MENLWRNAMTQSGDEMGRLAKRFIDAIEAGDAETIAAIYADDATIWHNHDNKTQTRAENLETLKGFIAGVPRRRYVERKVTSFPGGFVHQHVLIAETAKGRVLTLPACLICTVADGRITRLDEYFDSAPLTAWIGRH